jgi:hypothetical protein
MSDDEFDLLDELYFLQSFQYLKETLDWEDERLLRTLQRLLEKGWIKCFHSPDKEVFGAIDLSDQGLHLYYLATKAGLLKHNTI